MRQNATNLNQVGISRLRNAGNGANGAGFNQLQIQQITDSLMNIQRKENFSHAVGSAGDSVTGRSAGNGGGDASSNPPMHFGTYLAPIRMNLLWVPRQLLGRTSKDGVRCRMTAEQLCT
jgi:hypothetical protein